MGSPCDLVYREYEWRKAHFTRQECNHHSSLRPNVDGDISFKKLSNQPFVKVINSTPLQGIDKPPHNFNSERLLFRLFRNGLKNKLGVGYNRSFDNRRFSRPKLDVHL